MKPQTIEIPKWLRVALLRWVEKAYRRGYQQGVLAGESGVKHDEDFVSKFRHEYPVKNARAAVMHRNELSFMLKNKVWDSLEDRHFAMNGVPYVEVRDVDGKLYFEKCR